MKENKKITSADVEHIARLARLGLTKGDKDKFRRQLDEILNYMEKLDELEMEGVEPLTHVLPLTNVLRRDEARPGLERESVLRNAPERKEGYFKVPPVIE